MNDLELGLESHDLVIKDGDLSFLNLEERVAQQALKINLLTFEGEWFLDITHGVPYFQSILRKGVSKDVIDSVFKQTILSSYNIVEILDFKSSIRERGYYIDFLNASTTSGGIVSVTDQLTVSEV